MNQYCYNIVTDSKDLDAEKLKTKVANIYRKKKFKELAFEKDDKLPFIVLYSEKDAQICIKMTSKAKKNIERIEGIHQKLKAVDLKVDDDSTLEKPVLFSAEQCSWWDQECQLAKGQKWATLEHNGPYFTHLLEPYEPHGAPLIYDGVEYELTPKEERVASFYAKRIISEQSGNVSPKWTEDKVFNQNFWSDFKGYLTAPHKKIFKDLKKVDFSLIVERLEELKELEKQQTEVEKTAKKVKAAEKKQDYGYAVINGTVEPVGNFTIEPAAIFYGRGKNPKRGKIKRDIAPEEVTINIGKGAPIPKPPAGHKWKAVINDQNSAWIASWKDPISNDNKYVYLGAEGQLKGRSDLVKYEKARKLNFYIDKVRAQYTADITSTDERLRQLGTVLYLIDRYGLRVGNEKDDTETDTVGASTLRVEHVKLKPPSTVVFDFLGKDSIRYYKEIPVDAEVYTNFKEFLSNKKPSDPLFNLISAADINAYLKTFDKDFSAKVFRTRLASNIMSEALQKVKVKKNATQDEKKLQFLKANVEVAKTLNHRRTIPPKSQEVLKKYQAELKDLQKKLKELEAEGKSTTKMVERIAKKKAQIKAKKSTLDIAATTSLTNYIDPRIVVSWAEKAGMTLPKVYSATLQRKFKWAIDTTSDDWDYEETDLMPEMAQLAPVDPTAVKKAPGIPKPKATPKPKAVTTKPKATPKPKAVTTKPKATPVQALDTTPEDIYMVEYSEKSIAVIGSTKPYKEILMELGGKFNPKLKVDGNTVAGWIFSKKNTAAVQKALGGIPLQYKDYSVEAPITTPTIVAKPKPKVVAKPLPKKPNATPFEGAIKEGPSGAKYVVFYSKSKDDDSQYLSNFEPVTLKIDGKKYPSVEHYFQAQKFKCLTSGANVQLMDQFALGGEWGKLDAVEAKSKGSKASMGKMKVALNIPCWNKNRDTAMATALTARFKQDQRFKDLLLYASKNNIQLYHFERSTEKKPSYWGGFIAQTGKYKKEMFIGENTLGELMMELAVNGAIASLKPPMKIKPAKSSNVPKTQQQNWNDVMKELKLSPKERNIIKCFAKDPQVVEFLREELAGWDVEKKIYSHNFLAKFLSCLDSVNKGTKNQAALYKKYQKEDYGILVKQILTQMAPSTVATFLFLIFILYKVSSRMKERYLGKLIRRMSSTKDIQQCLCDNPDQESLISMDTIGETAINDLYLLPSGRCVALDDLVEHLKKSENKSADPTFIPGQHKDKVPLWTNGWELQEMLNRVQEYNYDAGTEIKKQFRDILKKVANDIPQKTKDMIKDVYALFYFDETNDTNKLVQTLVKYGYPNGETPGNVEKAKAIVEAGSGDELDEFRTLLGFKLGHHIVEELNPKQREAVFFTGEFAGLGREAWGKLSMGEFCTKTFGSILHRMANIFDGKWNF